MESLGVFVSWKSAKIVKDFLDGDRLLAKSLKTVKSPDRSRIIFPLNPRVTRDRVEDVLKTIPYPVELEVDLFEFPVNKSRKDEEDGERGVRSRVTAVLREIIRRERNAGGEEGEEQQQSSMRADSNWEERQPKWKWERHEDLVILPRDPCFQFLEDEMDIRRWSDDSVLAFIQTLAPGSRRLAVQGAIRDDDFRSPRLQLILGESTVVRHKDNGIVYEFDASKCMFSSGNITEKLRVAKLDCAGQTVVDLFAGVGYFTLPYLVHAKAARVIACEWNPDAILALKTNLRINGVADRCTVLAGDNRETCPAGVAHRLNLGLLPSAEAILPVAARALKQPVSLEDVRWIHVHANVDRGKGNDDELERSATFSCNKLRVPQSWIDWAEKTRTQIQDLLRHRVAEERQMQQLGDDDDEKLESSAFNWTCRVAHCEHVKSYGPRIDHLVLDVKCQPVAAV